MKNNTFTKLFSFFLSVLLLFYAIPTAIFAEAADVVESGKSDSVDAPFPDDAVHTDEHQNEKVLPKMKMCLLLERKRSTM